MMPDLLIGSITGIELDLEPLSLRILETDPSTRARIHSFVLLMSELDRLVLPEK